MSYSFKKVVTIVVLTTVYSFSYTQENPIIKVMLGTVKSEKNLATNFKNIPLKK